MPDDLLNLDRLGEYLRVEFPEIGELHEARKFSDGQSNPTFLLTSSTGRYVLRRQPA